MSLPPYPHPKPISAPELTAGATSTPLVPPFATTLSVPTVSPPLAHATIQNARNAGAVAGTMLMAPLAPAIGPITVNVADVVPAKTTTAPDGTKTTTPAQEPMVVVAVKHLWDSPTIKALRNAVGVSIGLAVLVVAVQLISAKGDIWAINWQTAQKAAIAAAAFSLATAYAAWWKKHDNNPVGK